MDKIKLCPFCPCKINYFVLKCKHKIIIIQLYMTKAEIEARLGKSAQLIEFTDTHFGIDHALFYSPLGERNIKTSRNVLVDYFRDGVKIGHGSLFEQIFQPSFLCIFKFNILDNEYEVMADASYRPGKTKADCNIYSTASDKQQLKELLANTYEVMLKLLNDEVPFEPQVNPVHYDYLASQK